MSGRETPSEQPPTEVIDPTGETLGQLSREGFHPPVMPQSTALREVFQHFQNDEDLLGVLIQTDDGYLPIFRVRAALNLSKPYLQDLYFDRPSLDFARQFQPAPPLSLPDTTAITDAIEAALARDAETRYDPILVVTDDGPPKMIDVRTLLERQRELLTGALQQVGFERQQARLASLHDRLTGLPNRPHAMDRLSEISAAHANDPGRDYAVMFLDFDRFKLINDSLGHDAGDELLIQISQRLKRTLERHTGVNDRDGSWMTARLGGDEFLVMLDKISGTREAEELAEAILDAMRPTFTLRGYGVTSSPSIGIATCHSSDGTVPADMVRDADTAMYRAKSQGRARYVLFDQSMQDESLERLNIETQLRTALQKNQLTPYYQPIIDCVTGRIAGFEALVRWSHPELGDVSPTRFIPIAEECGAIGGIGRFMIEQAVHQLKEWSQTRDENTTPLYMSINISKQQLLQPGCVDHLAGVLEETGVPPGLVYLEVTETIVIDHADNVVGILNDIKQLGVKLSMDDFGTGLSSLTYLHKYPVDVLKIDRGFVKNLETDSIYTAVVLAIVTLAKNLGMSIVVEGIERVEQLVQIQALDCEYAQGFLFSKALPAHEAIKLVDDHRKDRSRFVAA